MKTVVTCSLTLDGVAQAPGRPDEDVRGDFRHGGWAGPYSDHVMGKYLGERMEEEGSLLLGRRTYKDLFSYWPKQTDGNPFTEVLNRTNKYVATRTLTDPLPWVNSTRLEGDAVEAVAALRDGPGATLGILGSLNLVRQLMRRGLIDEYVLLTHPLVLGEGQRLFGDDGTLHELRLVDSVTTTTGVVIASYRKGE